MTLPQVSVTQLDGAMGVLPPSLGKAFVVLGPADSGSYDTPAAYARDSAVRAAFTGGPLVEACSYAIQRYGRAVIPIRTHATTAGSYGTLDSSLWTGTSVPTVDAATHPNDDYDAVIKIIAGGTIAQAGITYQYSLDGGLSFSGTTALGTANHITIPNTGGVDVDFAAGTVVAGDTISWRCNAPTFTAADILTALEALKLYNGAGWGVAYAAGIVDADVFDALETKFAAMQGIGKWRAWVGNTRMPNAGESEATYATAMNTIFSAKTTLLGSLYSGSARIASAVTGRRQRRPVALAVAARQAAVDDHINIADLNLGPLPGVELADANGNPLHHDEMLNPGLDDMRFGTLRTFNGRAGVFVTRPRILCPVGSDFTIMPYRRVMNLAIETLLAYLEFRLSKEVIVDSSTGYILEEEAREIEKGGRDALIAVLGQAPKVSGVGFTVSRTDNLLSTKTMTCEASIVPLAYPEFVNLKVGFVNPVRAVTAA